MIIDVGLRTDIPAHYSDWLFNRFEEGIAYARNPLFPNRVSRYLLTPDLVDAVLFCSKNYAPALDRLPSLTSRFRTLFHATINAYGQEIEPNTPPLPDRIATLRALREIAGDKIFWRYDPIFLSDKYSAAFHFEVFEALATQIAPYVRGCIINFIELKNDTGKRLQGHIPLTRESRLHLLEGIGKIAERMSLPVRLCGFGEDFSQYHIRRGGCVTLADIGAANGCAFVNIPHTGNRRGCACITARDLGWYDTCPSGCKYCNAIRNPKELAANLAAHDPRSPILIGHLHRDDIITDSVQKSFLLETRGQISFFD